MSQQQKDRNWKRPSQKPRLSREQWLSLSRLTPQQVLIQKQAMAQVQKQTARRSLLLRVQTDYFVAGAVWEKIGGVWSCVKAAPIIKWLRGMNPNQAKIALLKMGAHYQFLPVGHGQPHEVTA